ncbi:signal transduction histidine kinase/DNA-binding response OmpR family regulator [Neorhizobium galegae]|uniref:ATP-binding protein n=1 Tax=Neorhizobium galegae TaxID=399 RepID=UPI001AE60F8B|nr:ATP-binding protein [Neorhizobium galegae]MBP2547178.1 signal transduction histidine kinase/DNA-binding response OmpR family regulator [Neorhizobium galegae]
MAQTLFSGDVIRKASRITAILQIFAVVLLAILVSVYVDISTRQRDMRDAVRENAMWSVYQLNRESGELVHDLQLMLSSGNLGEDRLQGLSLRYDVVFSRMDMLKKAQFEKNFAIDVQVGKHLNQIQKIIFESQPVFDAIAAGQPVSLEELQGLDGQWSRLVDSTSELLVYTNTFVSSERAKARIELEGLQRKSIVLIGLLVLSVAFLILTLQRQLRSVQAAGVSLEAMAEQLSVSYQAAEAGNRAKSQFMATMGHEIRTPLNAILGMVELLELGRLSAETSAHIRTIRRSGEALLDIINEILDYAKIEHGKLELERRPVDLQALAETCTDMMRGRAAEAGNTVTLEIAGEWHARTVLSDPTRLRQVILNFISNGVKFTQGGRVTLRMSQTRRKGGLWLRVEVQDTGIGIDEEGKAKLFQPFSQVDASISRRYGGTGLGLIICKEIIDRFGGSVGVDSTVGEGSTFWFDMPIEATEAVTSQQGEKGNAPLVALRRLRILVAEDNKVNQQVILGYLDHLGQDATLAENGALAVERAAAEPFDLILMDMQMPVMDGIEATRQVRAGGGPCRDVPVVALTANASEEDRRLCLEAGMTGFQAKPIGIAVLHRLIREVERELGDDAGLVSAAPPAAVSRPQVAAPPATPVVSAAPVTTPSVAATVSARRQEIAEILGEDGFQELLDAFFEDAVDILAGLHAMLASGERHKLDPLLHNLKGSASNIGLMDISDLSQALRHSDPSPADIDLLAQMVNAARQSLAAQDQTVAA